jgi:hypothetical protein
MTARKLKELADEILSDFEKTLADIHTLSSYTYDHKRLDRLIRIYYEDLTKNLLTKFEIFHKAYEEQLNRVCKRSLSEMSSVIKDDENLSSKVQFWSTIFKPKHPEIVIQKYLDAAVSGNEAFMYFIENEFVHSIENNVYQQKLQNLIRRHKKLRITENTQKELAALKSIYGFYLKSMDFVKNPKLNPVFIQDLFASLNRLLHTPIHELVATN